LSRGGGIININGSPTLTNLIFKENLASDKGGGMYNTSGSAPPIDGCTFTNNIAAIGGGMACANGSSSVLTDNIFVGNTATLNGGALACFGSSPHVGTGLFVGNSAANGGAIYADDTSGPRLINCTISENQADTSGGGIKVNDDPSVVEVINTILWGNTAAAVSDQVATFDSSSFSFKHCDLQSSNGSGTNWVGTLGADDTGNIDADPKFDGGGATSTTSADSTYSAITCSTTVTDSTGSFSANELIGKFLNPDTSQRRQFPIIDNTGTAITFLGDFFVAAGATYETFDYHLESGVSPCIDAGFGDGNAGTPIIPTTDLDGRSRVDHPIFTANTGTGDPEYVDMGTYESQGTELLITEWAIAGTHSNGGGEVAIPAFEGYNISRFCTDCKLKVTLTREIDVGSINTSVLTINNSLNEDRSSRIADPVTLENGNFTLVFDFSPFLDNIDSYTFELSNGVTDTQSNAVEGLRSINISFLVGDVNNDTVVNSDDSVGVKTRVRNPITADNARYDVNMDGRINIGDYSAVFSRQGHKLPQEVD
jgi:predicted outer membrane repeat protein